MADSTNIVSFDSFLDNLDDSEVVDLSLSDFKKIVNNGSFQKATKKIDDSMKIMDNYYKGAMDAYYSDPADKIDAEVFEEEMKRMELQNRRKSNPFVHIGSDDRYANNCGRDGWSYDDV